MGQIYSLFFCPKCPFVFFIKGHLTVDIFDYLSSTSQDSINLDLFGYSFSPYGRSLNTFYSPDRTNLMMLYISSGFEAKYFVGQFFQNKLL